MRRTDWDRRRWLRDEQSGAPCFPRLPKDGGNDLRGGDWASPQDSNSRDKTPAFWKKKATRQAQTVRVSEWGVGWQDLEAPGAPSSYTSTATLGNQWAAPERSRRPYAWSCPATGGRSGARWGSGRRRGGAFSVGLPLAAPTFPTRAITLARGWTIPQRLINTRNKQIPLPGSRWAGPAGRRGSRAVSGGRSTQSPRGVRRTATARGVVGSAVGRCVRQEWVQEGAGPPGPPRARTRGAADLWLRDPTRGRCWPPAIQRATAERTGRPCAFDSSPRAGRCERSGVEGGRGYGLWAFATSLVPDTFYQPASPTLGLSALTLAFSISLLLSLSIFLILSPFFLVLCACPSAASFYLSLWVSFRISDSLQLCISLSLPHPAIPLKPCPFLLPFTLSSAQP